MGTGGGFGCKSTSAMKLDLHTHTTASDGVLSPSELVGFAKAANLDALAITDHDTVAGLDEALKAGLKHSIHWCH